MDQVGAAGPDQALAFTTNLGDVAVLSEDHPLRIETDHETREPRPYLHIRNGLEARLTRPVFYELAEMAVAHEGAANQLGVWSNGIFFELGPIA